MAERVLVVGSGGREHALAWKLAKSAQVAEVMVAPGNAGTVREHKCRNVSLAPTDFAAIVELVQTQAVSLVVVGPEEPLVLGLVDTLEDVGIAAFGPVAAAAKLEGSKSYCKEFLQRNNIPTAPAQIFSDAVDALAALRRCSTVPVIKAAGLAAGKGVVVAETQAEAAQAVREMLIEGRFGEAGNEILLEERLFGQELSVLAFCDGDTFKVMPVAQDHKRLANGDTGLNTGGMGAFCPSPHATEELLERVGDEILAPTLAALARLGHPYKGVLYAGLMLTESGPKVIEFNCRFGDPETQAVLPLLESDLYEVMLACCAGRLTNIDIRWSGAASLAVVMASAGYPTHTTASVPIQGIDAVLQQGCRVFHAATAVREQTLVSAGGRILAVNASAATVRQAAETVYRGLACVDFEGAQFRDDIGRELAT